jgi:hypothetical protein
MRRPGWPVLLVVLDLHSVRMCGVHLRDGLIAEQLTTAPCGGRIRHLQVIGSMSGN